jgi:hypothetical protein
LETLPPAAAPPHGVACRSAKYTTSRPPDCPLLSQMAFGVRARNQSTTRCAVLRCRCCSCPAPSPTAQSKAGMTSATTSSAGGSRLTSAKTQHQLHTAPSR